MDRSGQAVVEYVLLLAVVVGAWFGVMRVLNQTGVVKLLTQPMRAHGASVYKYGHPKATGPDEGTTRYHPRLEGEKSFRIFMNPQR